MRSFPYIRSSSLCMPTRCVPQLWRGQIKIIHTYMRMSWTSNGLLMRSFCESRR